ncbi:VRR-NUC domain-containing protein [Clostridium botulinum]|uniref:VRR-NUC domain-containing protein n=1 Tax=Clostridium botulinum TaxID=1491 RepID=UPI000517C8B9|nr:VRR-NUC domain-containing protein [Clostridium botulinum]
MAAEKKFENEIKKFLSDLPHTWFFKYWAGPYSKSGIPDIIACVDGHFVGIEVKAPNGKPSELQKRNVRLIQECRGLGIYYILKILNSLKKICGNY